MQVQVRARTEDDIRRLLDYLGLLDHVEIIDMPDADYRWRVNLPRDVFAGYLVEAVDDITYETSVKDVLARGDKKRKRAMMTIWSAMANLQETRPWSGAGYDHDDEVPT
jgi:hypothetical protein